MQKQLPVEAMQIIRYKIVKAMPIQRDLSCQQKSVLSYGAMIDFYIQFVLFLLMYKLAAYMRFYFCFLQLHCSFFL